MRAPLSGRVTSKFGSRIHPITHKRVFHNGVDIAAPIGTAVVAPEDGRVTEVWDHEKGGHSLAMVGISNTRYGFAHLSAQLHPVGKSVTEGMAIAKTGNSGASTGPHVHFTVKRNGVFMDPEAFFKFL